LANGVLHDLTLVALASVTVHAEMRFSAPIVGHTIHVTNRLCLLLTEEAGVAGCRLYVLRACAVVAIIAGEWYIRTRRTVEALRAFELQVAPVFVRL
jgi:hypothetical protein